MDEEKCIVRNDYIIYTAILFIYIDILLYVIRFDVSNVWYSEMNSFVKNSRIFVIFITHHRYVSWLFTICIEC